MYMHPEIEAVLNNLYPDQLVPDNSTLVNAEKVLNYIEDINLERTGKFELTPAESLYLLWEIENWDLHIECLNNGNILYTFRKGGFARTCGSAAIHEFIHLLEKYLLMGIC
jgi:hypothetical protein